MIKDNNTSHKGPQSLEKRLSKTLTQLYVKLALVAGVKAGCFVLAFLCLTSYSVHRVIVWRKGHMEWEFSPLMDIERPCPPPTYATMRKDSPKTLEDLRICITTLTDKKTQSHSPLRRMVRWRNYDDILDLTWESKQQYADKHGYYLFDGSDLVDPRRPAQWSKILAAQHLLTVEQCDWVLWHDADTLFMNTSIRIEDFLPQDPRVDLLVAVDDPNPGYNSGSWLVKNSEWGRQFLQDWWDMESFVRLPGQSLSGDNDAFKVLLDSYSNQEFATHVGVPPRCTINSFAKFLKPKDKKDMTQAKLRDQPWYLSENFYHKGDFLVHVAGYDNKIGTLKMLMERIQ